MSKKFVDQAKLKELRDTIPVLDVLRHFGLAGHIREKSVNELRGPCPLHGGDNESAFEIKLATNRWRCYTKCGTNGSVVDLVAIIQDISFVEAARYLLDNCEKIKKGTVAPKTKRCSLKSEDDIIPLSYLPQLDTPIEYLKSRKAKVSLATAALFGVGIVRRGTMQGQLLVPLRWDTGALVGYAHKVIGSQGYEFKAGTPRWGLVYNLFRIGQCEDLILTEGYFDVMKVYQAGYHNVVASCGTCVTPQQLKKVMDHCRRVILFLDGDKAGWQATGIVGTMLVEAKKKHKIIALASGDPGDMSDERIRTRLAYEQVKPY